MTFVQEWKKKIRGTENGWNKKERTGKDNKWTNEFSIYTATAADSWYSSGCCALYWFSHDSFFSFSQMPFCLRSTLLLNIILHSSQSNAVFIFVFFCQNLLDETEISSSMRAYRFQSERTVIHLIQNIVASEVEEKVIRPIWKRKRERKGNQRHWQRMTAIFLFLVSDWNRK